MPLTTEQRARRRTKKINKRVAMDLPLFAGTPAISQFLTDEATQAEAVKAWDAHHEIYFNEIYFERLKEAEIRELAHAADLRQQVAALVSDIAILDTELAAKRERYPSPFSDPYYVSDFWYCKLKALR